MDPADVPILIAEFCGDEATDFKKRIERLFAELKVLTHNDIVAHVEYAGVIPEFYSHDSSEEKLFAKYCDYLLAKALAGFGMNSSVIAERADAADVTASIRNYSLVGDAKAFRLSRTAKNQKDFKVEALNTWKKNADYACLVCPLYQYPTRSSQIYDQAIRYNVTLLSFTHLGFLLRAERTDRAEFDKIWNVSAALDSGKNAVSYWNAVNRQVARATGNDDLAEWDKYILASKKILHQQAHIQLKFWESKKDRIRTMDHNEAVEALISALRIDNNINTITKTLAGFDQLIPETD